MLLEHGIRISMDGKGRYMDNIFVERLWRSVKYEEVYLKAYQNVPEARAGIGAYLRFYNCMVSLPNHMSVHTKLWATRHRKRYSKRDREGGVYMSRD